MNEMPPIPNTACLVQACEELSLPYTFYDDNKNFIGVEIHDREYFFVNVSTPFNEESIAKIYKDKEFTYRLLKDVIRIPECVGYLDPEGNPKYRSYASFKTHEEIVSDLEKRFTYPFIIKMNSGLQGRNVFKCVDRSEVFKALGTIFARNSHDYDYVALGQTYIPITREFRVLVFQGGILLAYEKDFSQASPDDPEISPLHKKNAKAVLIQDEMLLKRLSNFIEPVLEKFSNSFAGIDIVLDEKNEFWLLELNSRPGFEYFVRDNGTAPLVEMYKRMLTKLTNR